jgi:hypothetical protein
MRLRGVIMSLGFLNGQRNPGSARHLQGQRRSPRRYQVRGLAALIGQVLPAFHLIPHGRGRDTGGRPPQCRWPSGAALGAGSRRWRRPARTSRQVSAASAARFWRNRHPGRLARRKPAPQEIRTGIPAAIGKISPVSASERIVPIVLGLADESVPDGSEQDRHRIAEAWWNLLDGSGLAAIGVHMPLWLWMRAEFPRITARDS